MIVFSQSLEISIAMHNLPIQIIYALFSYMCVSVCVCRWRRHHVTCQKKRAHTEQLNLIESKIQNMRSSFAQQRLNNGKVCALRIKWWRKWKIV